MGALSIISQSWPIAMMFISVAASGGVYLIVRRVTDTSNEQYRLRNDRDRLEMQSELHRLRAIEHKS